MPRMMFVTTWDWNFFGVVIEGDSAALTASSPDGSCDGLNGVFASLPVLDLFVWWLYSWRRCRLDGAGLETEIESLGKEFHVSRIGLMEQA